MPHRLLDSLPSVQIVVPGMSTSLSVSATISALDAELARHYSQRLAVAPFLTRRLVSFQANKDKPHYRWYKFKEAFSAELVEYLLHKFKISGRILDPFAGIGTTLFAASKLGIASDGIELLPVGQEIVSARLALQEGLSSTDRATLKHWADRYPWQHSNVKIPLNTIRITKGAYPLETVDATERYLGSIQGENKKVFAILRFALLCVLEAVSYTRKDGQYLRWDYRAGRGRGAIPFNKGEIIEFSSAIREKIYEILSDTDTIDQDRDHLAAQKINLRSGSCLDIMPKLPSNLYDAVLTSPPYCNRYDYTRTYALELALMGMSDAEVIAIRQKMLSCTVENRTKSLQSSNYTNFTKISDSDELLAKILQQLENEKKLGNLNNNGIPRMIRGYFNEMSCVIGECHRVLKPGAPLIMINDNVRYAGISISVDLILSRVAEKIGFTTERIFVVPSKKGNSSQQMGTHGRIPLRKCVYVWRKGNCGISSTYVH